jgi:tetratricopeptide (TPR) repeat protein
MDGKHWIRRFMFYGVKIIRRWDNTGLQSLAAAGSRITPGIVCTRGSGACGYAKQGEIMGLLDIFKGKDPVKQEERGDLLFESGEYGQARLEYEAAVEKRRRDTSNDARIPVLDNKILKCGEALASLHRKRADNLAEAGYYDEAREYYTLALELARDPELTGMLERGLQAVESRQIEATLEERTDADSQEHEIPEKAMSESEFESEDEYAEALFNTLPDELCEIYMNYGENFKRGYVALHQRRFETASEYLSLALKENPGPDSHVRLELATVYLNLKRGEEALELLDEFVPKSKDIMTYSMLCEVFWDKGLFDRALALRDSLSAEQKADPYLCRLHGDTLFRMGEYHQAELLYLNFLKECGWDRGVAGALAETYEAMGDHDDARELYRKVIDDCGACHVQINPQTLRRYADLCLAAGIQNKRILEIYLNLTEKDPDNAAAYCGNISRIYAALGHEKESKRFAQIALRYAASDSSSPTGPNANSDCTPKK